MWGLVRLHQCHFVCDQCHLKWSLGEQTLVLTLYKPEANQGTVPGTGLLHVEIRFFWVNIRNSAMHKQVYHLEEKLITYEILQAAIQVLHNAFFWKYY